ncbi:MAG TPA: hypothetical protein VFN13_14040, partial [Rudaea sp.]|nr:hypothetical protein [Rudaea sp.]
MNNPMHRFAASVLAICLAFCAIPVFSATVTAPNNPPDLGTIPPDLSPSVDPNIVVTFDDSGSMVWTHMGDDRPYDGGTWDGPWRCANVIDPRSTKVSDPWSRAMNGVYYNPNIKYTSPLKEDGSSFDPADATLTRVPVDGIYIKRPTNPGSIGTAAYYNNPDGDSNSDDNSATNLMGKYTVTNQKKTTTYYGGSCPGNEDTGSCSLLIAAGTNSTGCPKDPDGNNAYNCQQKELCTAYRSNGDCKSGGHYSPRRYTYTWSDTYQWAITTITTTTTDDRWMCGAGGTSGTSGDSRWKASRSVQNPFDGSVADPDTGATPNGGPVYWRFKQSAQSALTVDSSTGKFTASALTALYNADNWEAVAVPSDQYQNFANWYAYYRYRNVMARTAMSRVFGVLGTPTSSNIRVLWQNLNDSTYGGGSSSKTGLNGVAISTLDDRAGNNDPYGSGTAYRKAFFDWIYQTPASGSTPSRFAAIRAGNFFSQSTVTSGATDPYWQEGTAGNKGQELACRQNFHLLMTDGLYNSKSKPTVVTDPSNTSDDVNPLGPPPDAAKWKGQNKYTASSSGADPTTIFYGGADKDGGDTYSNIAFYYWARNLRPDLAKRDPNDGGNDGVPAYYPDQTTGVTGDVAPVDANNPGATPEVFWNPNNDPATWPHLVQFAVSLGAFGDLTYSDDLDCNKDDGFGIGNNDACKLRKGVKNSSGQIGWPQPNGDAYSGSGIPANIDDLWHAALNSRGAFFVATDPSSLVQHLSDIIQSVLARAQTSTSEAVSSNILPASGTTLGYAGGYDSGNWYGYVYQYTLDAETGIAKEANWDAGCILTGGSFSKIAPTSTTPPRGSCKVTSPPPAPPSRFIFTSINSGGTLVGAPFQWSDLGTAEQTMLNLDPRTTDVDPTTGQVITTPTANAPALDDGNGSDRVKYLRGLRDNETAPTTEASPRQFRIRQSLLGPIVNSQVIYEGAPSSGLSDIFPAGSEEEKAARPCIDGGVCKSYEQFVKQYIDRTPLIYVGGNDGMLHAFDASSGEEQWAYVPNMLYGNGQLDQLTNPKSGL